MSLCILPPLQNKADKTPCPAADGHHKIKSIVFFVNLYFILLCLGTFCLIDNLLVCFDVHFCVFARVCVCVCASFLFFFVVSLLVCLFERERESKKSWVSIKVGKIWEELGKKKT